MSKVIVRLVYGALSGSVAAACMTVVRSAARRRGMIEKTVPQVVEESIARTGRAWVEARIRSCTTWWIRRCTPDTGPPSGSGTRW